MLCSRPPARVSTTAERWAGDTQVMGFNPHRRHRGAGASDLVFVAAALAVAAALVAWAFLG